MGKRSNRSNRTAHLEDKFSTSKTACGIKRDGLRVVTARVWRTLPPRQMCLRCANDVASSWAHGSSSAAVRRLKAARRARGSTMLAPMLALLAFVALLGCGDNLAGELAPDAHVLEPTTCDGWEAITADAPEIGEVRVEGCPFFSPTISYCAADGVSSWHYTVRRYGARVGTYGRGTPGSTACEWRDSIEERTPATGMP